MLENEAFQRLMEERERLQQLRRSLAETSATEAADAVGVGGNTQHPADLASELFDRSKDLSILDGITANLGEVEHAIQRIEGGTYGFCEACGRPIGEVRLDALPAARFCRDDQARAERSGSKASASLGYDFAAHAAS